MVGTLGALTLTMHMGTAARDLKVGQVFVTEDRYHYSVRAIHTHLLEGYDRLNKVALELRDLESGTGRVYLMMWDANTVVSLLGKLGQEAA